MVSQAIRLDRFSKNVDESSTAILTPLGYCLLGSTLPLPKLYNHLYEQNSQQSQCTHEISEEEKSELMKMQDGVMGIDYKLPYENDRNIAEEEIALKLLNQKTIYIKEKQYSSVISSQISYAEKLEEAVNIEGLFKKLTFAQEKLKKIPDIEKTINDFCKFVDELAETPNTNGDRFKLFLKYDIATTEDQESDDESEEEEKDEQMKEQEEDVLIKMQRRFNIYPRDDT